MLTMNMPIKLFIFSFFILVQLITVLLIQQKWTVISAGEALCYAELEQNQ